MQRFDFSALKGGDRSPLTLEEKIKISNEQEWPVSDSLPPCPKCRNKRIIYTIKGNGIAIAQCSCLADFSKKRKQAGSAGEMAEQLKRKCFADFETSQNWQKIIKTKAFSWAKEGGQKTPFLAIFGQTGAGKTHLAAAALNKLGKEYNCFFWEGEILSIKNLAINDFPAYSAKIEELKTSDILFIDNWLAGKRTETDLAISAELLGFRAACRKITVLTCALQAGEVAGKWPGLFGRISAAAGPYFLAIKADPSRNYYCQKIEYI